MNSFKPALFDDHAQAIAKRQYMQPGDGDIYGMFRRVAAWVASAERSEQDKQYWSEQFYQLMASKRFCPGGRVLAGAGTQHGNVLNCFVQGATEHDPSSFEGIMEVATKLALVTKVGGGNGVNLDPYVSRKNAGLRGTVRGFAYISANHADVEDFIKGKMRPPINPDGEKENITVRNWTRVVYGLLKPELAALARRNGVMTVREKPADVLVVPDDMRGIIEAAKAALSLAVKGQEPHVDFSSLRPEGAPIKGSGGTSSGPVSFLVEIFDNFLEWANLGAEKAGPVATLRYVYAPVLRVVRQGGTRRGAGMATIAIDHPDLLDFLTAKDLDREASEGDISTFNISILVTEAFWQTLQADGLWAVEPSEVPGKYYPYPVQGPYTGTLPDLPERAQDGARPIPVYDGKVPARWLWHEIAWHAWATGEPGLIFVDRINELSALKNLGPRYQIRSTNPCFVGSTRIPSEFGLLPIEQLTSKGSFYLATDNRAPLAGVGTAGRERGVTVRRAAKAFYTGEREVVHLKTHEGVTLTLTPNHPLLTPQGYVEAGQLKPGDKLLVQSGEGLWAKEQALPPAVLQVVRERVAVAGGKGYSGRLDVREQYANMPTQWSENLGLVLGWLVGDGYLREDGVGFFFGNREFAQAQVVVDSLRDWFGQGTLQATTSNTQHLHFNKLPAEFFSALGVKAVKATEKRVPESIFTAPREAVVGFLRGLFSTDGTVERNDRKQSCSVRLASSSLGLLEDVQLLLLNFGIFGRIHHRRAASFKALPDGRGGLCEYPVAEQYELIIGSESRDRFAEIIGFALPEKQAKLEQFIRERSRGGYRQRFEVTVSQVEPAGIAPVYDLTEPVTHSLIAGGVVAHNCGEIPLTVGEPCDLGAINLAAYVDGGEFNFVEFRKDVHTAIRFLDNVLDVNIFALEDNRIASQTLRRLGLGVMGLADMLIKLGLPYSSEAGRRVVAQVMNVMREEAIAESERLGQERGVFPLYEQNRAAFEALGIRPRRNVAVLTVAPTGTTSMLMGVSSGIEPMFSPFMWRRIGGEYKALLHPLFVEMMEQFPASGPFEKNGAWDWDAIIEAIQANHGSVKGLEGIPSAIASVFEGAHDVPPLDHVRMQGVVQTAFDAEGYAANSLSKTINLPNQATVEDVEAAYTEAYMTGCKGITVYRDGSREYQVLSVSKEEKKEEKAEGNSKETVVVQPALLDVPPSTASSRPESERTARPIFERTGRLVGYTDMVKLTAADGTRRGFLVTVNMQGEHPVEVILTSGKAGDEANADSEALGRIISKALQYGVPVAELVKTLRGINGGLYGSYQGRFVTSKADLIAVALETTSKIQIAEAERKAAQMPVDEAMVPQALQRAMTAPIQNISLQTQSPVGGKTGLGKCPECGDDNLVREEGCTKCYSCGYSKCG
ncbi:intein-containing adenosylcobalamin-dependent ribonucleoside-diphosphate reductase [Meiothermus cerbereus]|uniref:intein-containing adenosylcobalamin-dependent ribonucleoside-diphosphate reductase n=2 Tax=Meiothermus cerbereus TaxID=65552 RepID=UPI000488CEDE|nr:intein-containing adenosylcobalamin-dependent ribonucleoside-diphosphate reductase [Meiothermus cerbereus]